MALLGLRPGAETVNSWRTSLAAISAERRGRCQAETPLLGPLTLTPTLARCTGSTPKLQYLSSSDDRPGLRFARTRSWPPTPDAAGAAPTTSPAGRGSSVGRNRAGAHAVLKEQREEVLQAAVRVAEGEASLGGLRAARQPFRPS